MVNIVAISILKEDTLNECLKLYKELVIKARKKKGYLYYDLFRRGKTASNEISLIELWEKEDYFQSHLKSAHFARLSPQINDHRHSITVFKNIQLFDKKEAVVQ